MGLRRSLPWMVCALLAACCVPALVNASPGEPSAAIVVHDNFFQDGSSSNTRDNTVEILPGSTVLFSYPESVHAGSVHNVVFDPGSAPAACEQTKGFPLGPAPPLPQFGQPQGWAGTCLFTELGTYRFTCGVHPMSGAVNVVDSLTPAPTATPSPTPTPTAASVVSTPPAVVPNAAPPRAISRVRIVSAALRRAKRTVAYRGTIANGATGRVKLDLTYRVGKANRRRSGSARIVADRFSGKVKLSAAHAKRTPRLTLTVAYAGDAGFLPSSKQAKVKIKRR